MYVCSVCTCTYIYIYIYICYVNAAMYVASYVPVDSPAEC